jgi:hypothetical protein
MTRQEHLLTIIAEECAEVAQRCSKAIRFGLDEMQPGQDKTNAQRIIQEYLDLWAVMHMLTGESKHFADSLKQTDASWTAQEEVKKLKVEKFLLYSQECGTLQATSQRESQ